MKHRYLKVSYIKKFFLHLPILSLISITFIILILVFIFYFNLPVQNLTKNSKATLILSIDNDKRAFEGEIIEGMTLLDALNLSTSVGSINFKYSIQNDGKVQIMAIDGHIIDGSSVKLSILLNSNPIETSQINKIAIKAGDTIEIMTKN